MFVNTSLLLPLSTSYYHCRTSGCCCRTCYCSLTAAILNPQPLISPT